MNIEITCKKAVDYISKKEEGRLSVRQRFQLWRHLAVCSLCRRFAHQNKMFHHVHHHQTQSLSESEKKAIADAVLRQSNDH